MSLLKNHPFAVEAYFENFTVLTFAVPKEHLEALIPECLELEIFDNKWAFIAIAMVQTKNLRPKGFPRFMGNDFFLIGYRIFTRYTNSKGKRLRGLYIIKSETDKLKMQILGNIFTHYNYTITDIVAKKTDRMRTISSKKSNFSVSINNDHTRVVLPSESPFETWKEARRFSGPLPFTFTVNESDDSILIVEGVRKNWKPEPIQIEDYHFEFLQCLSFKDIVLANAFQVTNVPYYWKKGKIDARSS